MKTQQQGTLFGPFSQILTMEGLPRYGPIQDQDLRIITDAGIYVEEGKIQEIAPFSDFKKGHHKLVSIPQPCVAVPAFVDVHTHICFAGSRAKDYALRTSGLSYQEIAAQGGGILSTVHPTRSCSVEELVNLMLPRLLRLQSQGIGTCEVKSGYGLTIADECKILEAIKIASTKQPVQLVPTCLAAHIPPPEYPSSEKYLDDLVTKLFPKLIKDKLSNRIDIFVDEGAFSSAEARGYLQKAKEHGFSVTLHADQFTRGGAALAAEVGAISADHLEQISVSDAQALKKAHVIPVVLPGASLGLGMPFAPARMLLDNGLPLVIASDWNPGTAPMGYLLCEAALLGAAQKLTMAETFAAITLRAAAALGLSDRGSLASGLRADFCLYPCGHYREILYHQGSMLPLATVLAGRLLSN